MTFSECSPAIPKRTWNKIWRKHNIKHEPTHVYRKFHFYPSHCPQLWLLLVTNFTDRSPDRFRHTAVGLRRLSFAIYTTLHGLILSRHARNCLFLCGSKQGRNLKAKKGRTNLFLVNLKPKEKISFLARTMINVAIFWWKFIYWRQTMFSILKHPFFRFRKTTLFFFSLWWEVKHVHMWRTFL